MSEEAELTTPTADPANEVSLGSLRDKLRNSLAAVEIDRVERLGRKEDEVEASLIAVSDSLHDVLLYLDAVGGMTTRSLVTLNAALADLRLGKQPWPILRRRPEGGRPPEVSAKDVLRGQLAAVATYLSRGEMTQAEASRWVTVHMPQRLKEAVQPRPKTLDGWRRKFDASRDAETEAGQIAYNSLLRVLERQQPNQDGLKVIMNSIEWSLSDGGIITAP